VARSHNQSNMTLIKDYIAPQANAQVIVLFGGSPVTYSPITLHQDLRPALL